jgi:Hemerythrin HHE cation binding domain
MAWPEVHDQILKEHRALGAMLDAIGGLLERFEDGDPVSVEPLRDHARALYLRFEAHLSFEDRELLPVLRSRRGPSEAEALVREHVEQRELLDFLVSRLVLPGRPAMLLARELRQFGELLREDMAEEEQLLSGYGTSSGSK